MKQEQLQESLSALISGFGYKTVRKALSKMQSKKLSATTGGVSGCPVDTTKSSVKIIKKRTKPNAISVVKSIKMIDFEKKEILFTMAKKYEAKEFMPNVNHVRDFLSDGERDVSRIKSRQQVTNAVFKRLCGLETEKLRDILERGLYGPPKRLEPFARAIEGFSRPSRSV